MSGHQFHKFVTVTRTLNAPSSDRASELSANGLQLESSNDQPYASLEQCEVESVTCAPDPNLGHDVWHVTRVFQVVVRAFDELTAEEALADMISISPVEAREDLFDPEVVVSDSPILRPSAA